MKHEPKNTIAKQKWCGRCRAFTMHRVSGGRVDASGCIPCMKKAEDAHWERVRQERMEDLRRKKQGVLFA